MIYTIELFYTQALLNRQVFISGKIIQHTFVLVLNKKIFFLINKFCVHYIRDKEKKQLKMQQNERVLAILISLFGIKALILLCCFNPIKNYLMREEFYYIFYT